MSTDEITETIKRLNEDNEQTVKEYLHTKKEFEKLLVNLHYNFFELPKAERREVLASIKQVLPNDLIKPQPKDSNEEN